MKFLLPRTSYGEPEYLQMASLPGRYDPAVRMLVSSLLFLFVHWQSYRNNWMSGYQSVEGEQKEHVPDNDALVIAPLWKFYEAAKQALVELEAIPPETPGVDWTYVEQRKQQMRLEIADFERRFPHYRHEDYDK
jgi:hypothetical protein